MTTIKDGTESVFFARVEKAMKNRGISTLKELSEKVKISGATISGWKKEGSIPQRRTLKTLSETLNVPPEWLLGDDISEPNWDAGVVLKDMDAGSETQYMKQVEEDGSRMTGYYADRVRRFMDIMRTAPSSHYPKLRADITDWLDKYQQWCEANHSSEEKLAAWKERTKSARAEKVEIE